MKTQSPVAVASGVGVSDTVCVSETFETLARRHYTEHVRVLTARLRSDQDAADLPRRPTRGFCDTKRITALDTGSSEFVETEAGNAQYLIVDDQQRIRVLEARERLVNQPPQCMTGRSNPKRRALQDQR